MSEFTGYDRFYDQVRRFAERSFYGMLSLSECITSDDYLNKVTFDPADQVVRVAEICVVDEHKAVPVKTIRYPDFVVLQDECGSFVQGRCPDRKDMDVVIRQGRWEFVKREV